MTSLRQRIRKVGISPQPWKQYKGEIRLLPISAQTLFKNKGLPWDILEIELCNEGWLFQEESLWEVISDIKGLYRELPVKEVSNEVWDDSWSEEDFINYFEKQKINKEEECPF